MALKLMSGGIEKKVGRRDVEKQAVKLFKETEDWVVLYDEGLLTRSFSPFQLRIWTRDGIPRERIPIPDSDEGVVDPYSNNLVGRAFRVMAKFGRWLRL